MKRYPLVSIVIPNYNGREFVVGCLKSVLNTVYPDFEVIFVDDNSSDGSVEMVEALFGSDPRFKVIRFSHLIGASAARNEGIRCSRGEYVAFLDNDTEVDANWLKELVKALDNDPAVGAAQCKTLTLGQADRVAGLGILLIPYLAFPLIVGARENPGRYNFPFYTLAVTDSMIVRRNVLRRIGLLDPDMFWGENLDRGFKIWLCGYKQILVPASIVYHAGGLKYKNGIMSLKLKPQFDFDKDIMLFVLKCYSLKSLLKYLPTVLLRQQLTHVLTLALNKHVVAATLMDLNHKKDMKEFVSMVLSMMGIDFAMLWWFLKNLRNILLKRYIVQRRIRKVSDDYVFKYVGINVPPTLLLKSFRTAKYPSFRAYLKRYSVSSNKS